MSILYVRNKNQSGEGSLNECIVNAQTGDRILPGPELMEQGKAYAEYRNGNANGAAFTEALASGVYVEGFWFKAGNATKACRCYNSSPNFVNCVFDGDSCSTNGACVHVYGSNANPTFSRCTIIASDNASNVAPGVYYQAASSSTTVFTNCLIYTKATESNAAGQVIYGTPGSATFNNCTVVSSAEISTTNLTFNNSINVIHGAYDLCFVDVAADDYRVVSDSELDVRTATEITVDRNGFSRNSTSLNGCYVALNEFPSNFTATNVYTMVINDVTTEPTFANLYLNGVQQTEVPSDISTSAVYVQGNECSFKSLPSSLKPRRLVVGSGVSLTVESVPDMVLYLNDWSLLKSTKTTYQKEITINIEGRLTISNASVIDFTWINSAKNAVIYKSEHDYDHQAFVLVPSHQVSFFVEGSIVANGDGGDPTDVSVSGSYRTFRSNATYVAGNAFTCFVRLNGKYYSPVRNSGQTITTTPENDGGGEVAFVFVGSVNNITEYNCSRTYYWTGDHATQTSISATTPTDWALDKEKTDVCTVNPYLYNATLII